MEKQKQRRSVLQDWVHDLSFMQQSVLIAAVRGPDGIRKDHVAKLLLRWLRRSFMISAFDGVALDRPYLPGGGSFTGPSMEGPYCLGLPMKLSEITAHTRNEWESHWQERLTQLVRKYLSAVDELPHHFQLHFMHAAEILGYKHPDEVVRRWWRSVYQMLVNDMHLYPETESEMNKRLGDVEAQWRAREEVTAKSPNEQNMCGTEN